MEYKRPMDKSVVELLRLAHKDLPRLTEQDVVSILELLKSEDTEIQITGVALLDTFNYFETPQTIYNLYEQTDITVDIDELDMFAGMVKSIYFDSERFKEEADENAKNYDLNLSKYVGTDNR